MKNPFSGQSLAAGLALSLALATGNPAASITGSFGLNGITISQNGADLATSTLISMADTVTNGAGFGDYLPIPPGTSFGAVTLDLNPLPVSPEDSLVTNFALSSAFGDFAPASALIIQRTANFLDLYFEGIFTPNAALLPGLDPTITSVRISVNQSGLSLSSSMTLTTPPVPEPATTALVGTGLIALGLLSRRRRQ
jgi:hypothetical protein